MQSNHECAKRILYYCSGSGQELLSAFGMTIVCHDSSVFLIRKLPFQLVKVVKFNTRKVQPN